jgi:hypothetical protein
VLARRPLEAVALALGGRAGARLTSRLGFGVGRMSLLRLIRALPEPAVPAPTVLGVDDFALTPTSLDDRLRHPFEYERKYAFARLQAA